MVKNDDEWGVMVKRIVENDDEWRGTTMNDKE